MENLKNKTADFGYRKGYRKFYNANNRAAGTNVCKAADGKIIGDIRKEISAQQNAKYKIMCNLSLTRNGQA